MTRMAMVLGLVIGLGGCVGASPDSGASAPAPVAQGVPGLFGRVLTEVNGAGSVTLNADGTGVGTLNGQPLLLSWTTEGEQFCRSGSVGNTPLNFECQTVEISGGTATFRRLDGTVSSQYRIG